MSELIWRPLGLSHSLPPRSPPLLVQTSFVNSSYCVQVTDLTFVWGESLPRREIIRRALNEDTSIDPSEDASQMKIMLEKLKAALSLDESQDEDFKVELRLHRPMPGEASPLPGLHLKATCQLPSPLEPLAWTFKLRPLPQTNLTKHLTFPLLYIASLHSEEVMSLLTIIKEKDLVISKMKDALEETKTSVANIIGGGQSRRRGLDKFDPEKWQKTITQSMDGAGLGSMVNSVFRDVEKRKFREGWEFKKEWEEALTIAENDVLSNWWEKLNDIGNGEKSNAGQKNTFRDWMDVESDGDISAAPKRLSTPSNLDRVKTMAPSSVKHERTSISDEEDEFIAQHTPNPPPSKGKQVNISSPVATKRLNAIVDEDETTDDDDDDLDTASEASKSPAITKIEGKLGGKVGGKIGGKTELLSSPSSAPAPLNDPNLTQSKDQKLMPFTKTKSGGVRGVLGGKVVGKVGGSKVPGDANNEAILEPPSRSISLPPQQAGKGVSTPKSTETKVDPMDEDEADRKRRQLREELAVKQKAPVKRRKF